MSASNVAMLSSYVCEMSSTCIVYNTVTFLSDITYIHAILIELNINVPHENNFLDTGGG